MTCLGLGYLLRYELFPNWSPEAVGDLTFVEDEKLKENIDHFFEQYHSQRYSRPYMCAHIFWGRDEKFAYIDLVCGKFTKNPKTNKIETEHGSQVPTRVKINSSLEVVAFDQTVDGENNPASYNWLFPKQIQEKDRESRIVAPWMNIHLKAWARHNKSAL